jgi:cell wall-associated NlpC family hydrolase
MLLSTLCLAGCATGRAVPRPFPGAPIPPPAPETPAPPGAEPRPPVPLAPSPAVAAILTTALALRGAPYRYGGSDPSGFDCSGFVQWVFAQHGIALPREVRDQFDLGAIVARDNVQPGDLVFFETVARGPSHVGIALGNGRFVHAPSSRGVVRVERYTAMYWSQRWIGARRITGESLSHPLERVGSR